jgi:hypothetical protein
MTRKRAAVAAVSGQADFMAVALAPHMLDE